MDGKPLIVLADDNVADKLLIKAAMENMGLDAHTIEISDGEQVIEFAKSECKNCPPRFIVLDMDMPKLSGVDVLRYLSDNPDLCKVPVIVFTSDDYEHYRHAAKEAGVIKYITKTSSLRGCKEVIKFLKGKLAE